MPISLPAIRSFLARPLDDWRRVKQWPEAKLDRMLSQMEPLPEFHTAPRDYQKAVFLLCTKHPGFMLLLDMGLGKTKVALDTFAWRHAAGQVRRLLVLVPNSTNTDDWREQVKVHTPQFACEALNDQVSGQERRNMVYEGGEIVVMTYAALLHMVCGRQAKKNGKGNEMKLDKKLVAQFGAEFQMIVADESTFIRNHQSTFYKACKALTKYAPYRLAMTGTPIGKDPQAFWSQFNFVDNGEALGQTLGIFRAAYFTEKQKYFGGFAYTLDARRLPDLKRATHHRSIRYAADECLSLPPLTMKTVRVDLPSETLAYYTRLLEDLKEAKGNFQLVEGVYHRMRQLAGGFLPFTDATGARHDIVFAENPKVAAAVDIALQVPGSAKCILFYHYQKTGEFVCAALKAAKLKHVQISGTVSGKSAALERFKEDPSCRFLVLNNSSGAFGLNLQCATYMMFLELPDDPIVRNQALRRAHRGGQEKPCFCFDILCKRSVDERIFASLEAGKSLFDTLVEGKSKQSIIGSARR